MFLENFKNKDFIIYFIYVAVFIVIVNRAYGMSNLLRFVFRYLAIGYSDARMKKLDDKWFDIQLFKITNGINTTNLNDARLIQRGLNEGLLKPSWFLFTSSWGDITIKMSKKKLILSYLMGLVIFIMGNYAWIEQTQIVDGFVKIDHKEFSYYISKEKLIITSFNRSIDNATVHSKEDCKSITGSIPKDSMFSIACTKLLDDRLSYKWWLEKEIQSVNSRKNTLRLISYIYCITSVLWGFSLYQFNRASTHVVNYKLSMQNQSS
ncbi:MULTISPECIES: hypothetical protein [Enterobacter]|uniref:SMODS and SLOG-associating 2TM effector domain-containing protein n=1 Tax=Enterobacter asburiae TaxID=61645 RepID=A0ABC9U6S3_ENTAS|nr:MULTISPECIES: hypothetical protein [Enterobacter]AZL61538.1 hypothetical protein EI562_00360 [Enterobacter asburiae]EHF5042041.1 hypothetical protein [Enterobacter asburiae]EMB8993607.1 hypothetical protein [Enterobacter asburiae]ESM30441.1 hypothetical protein L402_03937 [Enterobacter asburiae]MCK6901216.1 hypothetical protein [Enterobacter asburiae]